MTIARAFRKYQPVAVSPDRLTQALTQHGIERITGVAGDSITLTNIPVEPMSVFLNGARLDPDSTPPEYTVSDRTIAFGTPLVETDVVTVDHLYRRQ